MSSTCACPYAAYIQINLAVDRESWNLKAISKMCFQYSSWLRSCPYFPKVSLDPRISYVCILSPKFFLLPTTSWSKWSGSPS